MIPFIPSLLLLLLLAAPDLLTPSTSQELQVRGQRTQGEDQDSIKVVISEGCATQGDSSDVSQGGKEINLVPGYPLVLTHTIKLVPSGSHSGPASCGCETDFAAMRDRLERLEREVSALREKCGGADGGCCTSEESKGAGCSIKPEVHKCPNECSDQGRCLDGKCVCFPGFGGLDCSESNCPGNCNDNGRCENGQCVCDPAFAGPDCSRADCPGNCNNRGRCVNGQCVCNSGFTGPDCSKKACPDDCNDRGRCVNGKCVCESGFTGADCSERACPGNCNNRGRCVNGECVCKDGFSGPDCSKRTCPNDCNRRGKCVNGKCVCDGGSSGADCSENSCPGNCNNRGRCVNGQCVCNEGFTGADCSENSCPGNCNNRGRCVNGQCVCNEGFTGADCSENSCPGNCNNRGRCVNGQCVCNEGFTGADCSENSCPGNCNNRGRCVNGQCVCNEGFTGADCSENSCPGNCNNRGRCVNGQCVCNEGFTGADCSENSCPGNCNNRGRCVNGQCVCNEGFTGKDCSENSCPGNCNNRGRCVNGQCVCNEGFTGADCSENSCPGNCNNRGRCVNGQCVCNEGFTGADCSENSCPGNCNNRGRCVNGQCVCNEGFTGADCSEKACPKNCSNRGRCMNGRCICDVGFAGPDCAAKACPNNCNNKGRCFKGRCVCRRGFTGTDCSQCEKGMTGPNCDTIMSGVSPLDTRDVTETSVTLVWTPPPVPYDSYHITFTSKKEGDQQIAVQVEGSLTSFTQRGLASGQEYTVSITGEINGRRGAESSAELMTLVSRPSNLQVVKTTTTSAVVQWEQSQGEIDRYRLTVTPSDGAGRSQDTTVPVGRNSAHIQQLEAGRLYDLTLVAEKGTSRSEPTTTQVTPGKTLPMVAMAALTTRVTLAPEQDVVDKSDPSPEVRVSTRPERREDGSEVNFVKVSGIDGLRKDTAASAIAKTKHLLSRVMARNGTRPKLNKRPTFSKNPNVPDPFRFNTTRVVPGARKVGQAPLKKSRVGEEKKIVPTSKKAKPGVLTVGTRTIALTVRDPSVEAPSGESRDVKNAIVMSGTDSNANGQHSLEEPTIAVGSKEQPDVGMASHGDDTAAVSSEPIASVESQEKKCMNKIKVTHVRLPHQDRGNGCRGDGTVLAGKTQGSQKESFATDGTAHIKPSSAETDLNCSPDPLHKLLTNTYDTLNITTFSVHLPQASNLSERVTKQILSGLKPVLSRSTPSSSSSTSQASTQTPSSPTLSSSASQVSPSSTTTPSSTASLPSLSTSSPSPPTPLSSMSPLSPSLSFSSSSKSGAVGSNEQNVKRTSTDAALPKDTKLPPFGKGRTPLFRRTPVKSGYVRHPRPNFGLFRNKTNLNLRALPQFPPQINLIHGGESKATHSSTRESLSSPSSSASEESSVVEANVPIRNTSRYKDEATTPASSKVEHNEKKMPVERGQIAVRHHPLKKGYLRRPVPNMGPFQNRTRPNLRLLPLLSKPLNPASEKGKEKVSSTELPASSSPPLFKESNPAEGTGEFREENEDFVKTSMSAEFNQTLRDNEGPSSRRPTTKVGYFRRPQLHGLRFPNKTHTNLRPPQQRGPIRRPFPLRRPNGASGITVGSQSSHLEKVSTTRTSGKQSGEQHAPIPTQGGQIQQFSNITAPTNESEEGKDNAPVETTKSREEVTKTPDSNPDFDVLKEKVNIGKNTGAPHQGRPTMKQTSSESRHGAPRPVTLQKRQPPTRSTQIRQYILGSERREDTKTNVTAKTLFDSRAQQTRSTSSKPVMGSDISSPGVTREPVDHMGLTKRTPDGLTLAWDSPERTHKNLVTRKEDHEEKQEDSESEHHSGEEKQTKDVESANGESEGEDRVFTHVPRIESSATIKPVTGTHETLERVPPGSAHSFLFENLPPQTEYTVTLLGKGPGLLSRLHKLVISTGLQFYGALENCPVPPTNIVFSEVTENSLTLSWTKPKSPISSFKVTYTHMEEGEPVSVSVDSDDSTLGLSHLTPGSTYEVSVISVLGLDESDPVTDFVKTLPDRPTDLRVLNVTDTKALLLWRPALAAVDKYAIVYGSGTGSELRVTVSGNTAEQQLSGLEESTTYTVTISSQLGSLESPPTSSSFTTTRGSGNGPHDLKATNVAPRSALLSWKPPPNPTSGYRLTYETEGQGVNEVILDASITEHNLTRLQPGSKYTVQLQAEGGGPSTDPISTNFTTGTLRFPFPTDCSQELLNGIRMSGEAEVFPQGELGTPVKVYCDMETDGGGWTVFQRRKDGSVNFFRGWKDYINGFGDLSGEFWLGLDSLHNLTTMTRMTLRVDLRDKDESVFAEYSKFEVGRRNYKLTVGGYSGTAGDSLSYHNSRVFSTKDRDPTPFITRCAMSYRGGWWYKNCHEANLNGLYGIDVRHQGVIWTTWKGKEFSIPFTEMKMRPAGFSPPTRG